MAILLATFGAILASRRASAARPAAVGASHRLVKLLARAAPVAPHRKQATSGIRRSSCASVCGSILTSL